MPGPAQPSPAQRRLAAVPDALCQGGSGVAGAVQPRRAGPRPPVGRKGKPARRLPRAARCRESAAGRGSARSAPDPVTLTRQLAPVNLGEGQARERVQDPRMGANLERLGARMRHVPMPRCRRPAAVLPMSAGASLFSCTPLPHGPRKSRKRKTKSQTPNR